MDAGHQVLVQRPRQPAQGLGPVAAPTDQLGQQRVVVQRNVPALVDIAVHAHARAGGPFQPGDFSRAGKEVVGGVFGVEAALDGVAAPGDVLLAQAEFFACGDAELFFDQVEPRD